MCNLRYPSVHIVFVCFLSSAVLALTRMEPCSSYHFFLVKKQTIRAGLRNGGIRPTFMTSVQPRRVRAAISQAVSCWAVVGSFQNENKKE